MRVGIIGCGAIGSVIAKALDSGLVGAELVALYDVVEVKCLRLAEGLRHSKPRVCRGFRELLGSGVELVVEAASQEAVREYVPKLLRAGISVVVLSVGALLNESFLREVREASKAGRSAVYVPSGALAGIDAVKAAALAGISKVTLITRKNPKSVSPEALRELGLGGEVREPTVVFEGSAEKAVKVLPFNINVAATLRLASRTPVHVRFVVDPSVERNIHEVVVESRAGRIYVRVENVPHPDNRKTSYVAALSAIELLRRLSSGYLIVGT